MRYEKCLTCDQLGKACDGPNLLLMDAVELGHWCDELRKKRPGATYDKTAAETKVSKTAVYNFLTGAHPDCRLETARPVARFLIGGSCEGNPCGNVTNSEKAAYEARIRQLENELCRREDKIQHLDDKIKQLQQSNASMETLITNTNARYTKDKDFLRGQITSRNKNIAVLGTLLGVCVLVIIGALVIDMINPDVGFFWLRGLFDGKSGIFSIFG